MKRNVKDWLILAIPAVLLLSIVFALKLHAQGTAGADAGSGGTSQVVPNYVKNNQGSVTVGALNADTVNVFTLRAVAVTQTNVTVDGTNTVGAIKFSGDNSIQTSASSGGSGVTPYVELANVTNQYVTTAVAVQYFATNCNNGQGYMQPEVANSGIRILKAGKYLPVIGACFRVADGVLTNSEVHVMVNGNCTNMICIYPQMSFIADRWTGPAIGCASNDLVTVGVFLGNKTAYVNGTNRAGFFSNGGTSEASFGLMPVKVP